MNNRGLFGLILLGIIIILIIGGIIFFLQLKDKIFGDDSGSESDNGDQSGESNTEEISLQPESEDKDWIDVFLRDK